jgi:DNA-binding NtrC family response regulator
MTKSKSHNDRILVVDDEPMMTDSLRRHLMDEGYAVDTAASGGEAIDLFDGGAHHLVICDLQLPDMDGLTLLRHMKDAKPNTEVIVVTGYGSVQTAVEATKAGAFYFVEKPFDFEELLPLAEKALERRELMAETESMRRQLSTRAQYFNIIGSSKQMQTIYETIESVAKSDANVLIVGESGTGKELIANAIHYNSLRAKKPFIKVNCAALPKELIESELFGHAKGAFTGAHADKEGLVQHAAGGSLMLDEIAEMPIELQPKLLRVLQERTCRKIGSEKSYPVDFRLITSTNRMPADAIRDGLLRDDLFLSHLDNYDSCAALARAHGGYSITHRPLPQVVRRQIRTFHRGVSQSAYQRLFSHPWPGNVRELQNVIERAILLAKSEHIEPVDLPSTTVAPALRLRLWPGTPPNMTLEDIEKFVIERTLQRTGGNKQKAANMLGIYRPRLYSKIKKYKIGPESVSAN